MRQLRHSQQRNKKHFRIFPIPFAAKRINDKTALPRKTDKSIGAEKSQQFCLVATSTN